MTNREQAVTTMITALGAELITDAAAFAGNTDYTDEVALFVANALINSKAATAAHADNSGFSEDKLVAKTALCLLASNLSGKAFVKFTNLGNLTLAEQLHIEPTDYSSASDSNCATLVQSAHDVMDANIGLLNPATITPAMLTDLQSKKDAFVLLQGSSDTVHEVSPELTAKFKASFKPVMKNVKHLKLLTRDYEVSNNKFFTRLMASTVIPTINVHHNIVAINATAKSTGKAVENIVFTLTKGAKSATTDFEGNAEIDEVRNGKDVLTGVLAGATVYSAHIVIKRSTTNHYNVVIDSL